jgi:hypothetical protein
MSLRRGFFVMAVSVLAACSSASLATLPPILGGPTPTSPARGTVAPRNGLEVIGAMRRAHPSRALKSLTYTVSISEPGDESGAKAARMHARLPGRFRESLLPSRQRTGSVRDRQRVAFFERGRRVDLAQRFDLTTLLAYDVFAQSIDTTIMWLDRARVRFGLLRPAALDGREVWVVGAEEGDTSSAQFWVDAARWVVLRVIQPDPRVPARIVDVRFTDFDDHLDVPVPTRMSVYRDGRLVERREMSNVVANPVISSRAFDLSRWRDLR